MENIRWFGHASFAITDKVSGNKVYFIDPYQMPDLGPEKADIIFITHAHPDHLSLGDIDNLLKPDTTVVATSDSLNTLKISDSQKFHVTPNQEYEIKGLKFETVPAYNTHAERLSFHPESNHWVGYILHVNGQKIYHAGDTDFIPEMKKFAEKNLDIAMLPMGGGYTMGVEEAIEAANAIAAKVTIPMHYRRNIGPDYPKHEEKLKAGVKNSKVEILEEVA
ncbi:MAG TPA: MBL fold metallo-hydrolase [Patescibacteria group bacterium]|nr:MBL fold metallo-hydrolase [Patescibacteria group bacterium]